MKSEFWRIDDRGIPAGERRRIERKGRWLARFLRIYGATWRLREEGWRDCEAHRALAPNRSLIFAFFHNRLGMLAYSHRDRPIQILNSSSPDGLMMSSLCLALGMGSVLGSSSRGGSAALRELLRRSREGLDLGLTVDGPRGPRGRVKEGIVALAALSGAPVIPVAAAAAPRKVFARSWDRSILPWPGARVLVKFGLPLRLDPDADREERERFRRRIEESLQALNDELDRRLGSDPIPPDREEDG